MMIEVLIFMKINLKLTKTKSNNFIDMLQIPIRKKVRNYPKDFTPPSGYLTPRVQQKSQQKSSASPYTHINNKSSKGHIINLNQSTQLIENPKQSTKNILFTINPQQNSRSHLSDVEKQSPLINQHLGRKLHYINPDLLKRPRIQENSDQQLVQIQQDEAQNSTPGSIRKNLPSQKPLPEQQPNYVHVPSKNIFSSNKLQVNDNQFYQSLKSQYINVSNLKNKKILSFNKSFQNQPSNSFRLGKRNSDTQLIQSHLQTTKEKSEQKKNLLDFGYLLEEKRVDKLKAHINQIAYDKVRNKQRIVSSNQTQADQANRFSYTQRKRPNSNFIQNNHEAYPELNGQNFQRRSSRIGGDSNVIERFDTQKQSRMRALSSSKQSFNMRGSKKITISYKRTSLNQLKQIFSSIAKTQSAQIQISVPNILMNIKFDRNIQKQELYAQSTNLFQCLGLPIQNITVKRYSNCILIVSKNVCILWHYDGKVYLGGWQVQYLDEGCKHGLGLQWVPNRHVYYGQFVQSKKQGLGVMKTNDQVYFGEWQKGKKTDNGFSICKNGQVTAQNSQFHRVSNINAEYNGFETDPFL